MTTVSYRVDAEGRSAALGATEVVIGRSVYCTMFVDDPSVSRLHASIRKRGNACEIMDLGSRNGTFVNGKKVGAEPVRVTPGDEILIGKLKIHLVQSVESSTERMRTSPRASESARAPANEPTKTIKMDWEASVTRKRPGKKRGRT